MQSGCRGESSQSVQGHYVSEECGSDANGVTSDEDNGRDSAARGSARVRLHIFARIPVCLC